MTDVPLFSSQFNFFLKQTSRRPDHVSTATAAETIHKRFLSTPKKTQQSEALHDRGYGITSTANDDTRSWRLKEQFALTLRRPTDSFFFLSVFKTARSDSHTQWTQRLLCFSTQSSVSGRPRRTLNVHPSPLQTQSPPGGQKHRQDGESGRVVVVVVVVVMGGFLCRTGMFAGQRRCCCCFCSPPNNKHLPRPPPSPPTPPAARQQQLSSMHCLTA